MAGATTLLKFEEFTEAGLDVNATTLSTAVDVQAYSLLTVGAEQASGTFSTAVFTFQQSTDNTNFYDIAGATLTGPGVTGPISVGARYFRVKVTTNQGGAGTADIIIQAKQ